jgi:hypothetical protein
MKGFLKAAHSHLKGYPEATVSSKKKSIKTFRPQWLFKTHSPCYWQLSDFFHDCNSRFRKNQQKLDSVFMAAVKKKYF